MTERDRVLEAYRNCISEPKCKGCPWTECKTLGNATIEIPRDLALAVMRELVAQEPRVMTPADVHNIGPEDICAFIEIREETHMYACYMRQYDETHTEIMCDVPDLTTKLQNGCARLWTSRPTDARREAVKWDE